MHKLRSLIIIALVIIISVLGYQLVKGATSDYDYVVTVVVDSGATALSDTPVAVSMNSIGLRNASFLQDDAEDWLPTHVNENETQGVAQGMDDQSVPWWFEASQDANAIAAYKFFLGDPDATRNQRFRFDGTTDTVTITDHADLDITDDLLIEVEVEVITWPAVTGTAYILRKEGAYEIGLGQIAGAEAIVARLTSAGADTEISTVFDENVDGLEVGTVYDVALYYDKDAASDNVTLYINDESVNTVNFTDALASTATDLILGSGFNGYLDAVVIDPPVLFESYTETDGIGEYAFSEGTWLGQAFTPTTTHTITQVDIYGRRTGSPSGTLYVGITGVDGSGKPTGANLAAGTADPSGWSTSNAWHEVTLSTTATLSASTQYAIVVNYPELDPAPLAWKNKNPGNYAGGAGYESFDSGASWGSAIGDFVFREWGEAEDKLSFDFEPDEMESTQEGNSGNSWTWTGTIEDVSTGGSDHDGTYSLTRDMSAISVWIDTLEQNELPTIDPTPTPVPVLGPMSLTPEATAGEVEFLFRTQVEDVLENADLGITTLAAWFISLAAIGIALTAGLLLTTQSPVMAALPLPTVFWVGYGLGTPIPLWVPLVFTFIAVGLAFGTRRFFEP